MEHRSEKTVNPGIDAKIMRFQGTVERDGWARVFHQPVPSTHELKYEWLDPMNLRIELVERKADTGTRGQGDKGTQETSVADDRAALLKKLSDMTEADLVTFAAEKSVALTGCRTKVAKVAAIADALAPA